MTIVREDDGAREVPASAGQRLLWLLDHYRGQHGALNEPLVWRISGQLNVAALRQALTGLVARHEALRTTFSFQRRQLAQCIHAPRPLPLALADLSGGPDPDRAVEDAVDRELAESIDSADSPIRARLWRVHDAENVLFLNVHHLVTDRRSNGILAADLASLYNQLVAERVELPEIGWQYAEWSEWQRRRFEAGRLRELQEYWLGKLAGSQLPALPGRKMGSPYTISIGAYEQRHLGPEVGAALRRTGDQQRCTAFPVALAVFYLHLHALTRQRDQSVASLFANRLRPEVQHTVGFFVNMLVLRVRLDPQMRFTELVRECRSTVIGALAHQELPYQMLPPAVASAETDLGIVRADDVVFQFVEGEQPASAQLRLAGADTAPVQWGLRRRFALEMFLACDKGGITALFVYDDAQFDRGWASRYLDQYCTLLGAATANPDATVAELLASRAALSPPAPVPGT
jgi:Condensation domain